MFSGQYKWLSIFGLLVPAVGSLLAVTTILGSMGLQTLFSDIGTGSVFQTDSRRGRYTSLSSNYVWVCTVLVVAPVWNALSDPSTGFEGGRLGGSPTSLSVIGRPCVSFVLYASLLGYSWLARYPQESASVFLPSAVMILAGGEGCWGIVGGFLSAILFFLIKRKFGSALALLSGMVGLGVVLVLFSTPLKSYFDRYAESSQADTLLGRERLVGCRLTGCSTKPCSRPWLYGIRKFVSIQLQESRWDASHLHNAVLEVLL